MEVVTGAMSTLLPKLGALLTEEYKLQKSVRCEITFLKDELESMQTALLKISEAPMDQQPDHQVKLWAREVRELSYDIEDKIDVFMVRVNHVPELKGLRSFIDRSLDLLTKAKICHKLGTGIKDLRRSIKEVSERRDRYKVDQLARRPAGITVDNLRLSALYKKATELVGTEKKSSELIEMLMEGDEASRKQLRIVSVAGFGGLGKTTLAKVVYDKLRGQFDCGAFVSVSLYPNIERILANMLHQCGGPNIEATCGEQQLIGELRKLLQDKMYFIVLDDIWNTNVWKIIQYALVENERGSRTIITTRSLDVAKEAGGTYQLEPLSFSDSTKLFYKRIFDDEEKCPPDDLAEVSRKILKKCGGVPLAIITIASMFANKIGSKNTHQYWSSVYQSMGSGLDGSTNVENMRRILSVSYYDLPSCLKSCLLHLCLFLEDHDIIKEDLIWKWIGEGFVHEEQGRTLYEVGEAYIEELVNRSMIQPTDIDSDSKTCRFRVHDMVLYLTNFLSNEEHFLTKLGGQQQISLPNKIRRLSLKIRQEEEVKQLRTMDFSNVRSLTVSSKDFLLLPNLSMFTVLRVLDLQYCLEIKNHHLKEFCYMFHLRYLRLDAKSITEIPKEIQNLQFLQVLYFRRNGNIEKIPSTFIHLLQLQKLYFAGHIRLPVGFGKLKSLQEADVTITIDSPSMLHDLGSLTELRTLDVYFGDWDESYEKLFIHCLSKLVNLKFMKIRGQMKNSLDSEFHNLYLGPQQLCSVLMNVLPGMNGVPIWMSSLCFLSYVNIKLLTLGEQDLQVLGSIPSLIDLRIHVAEGTQDRDGRLVIGKCYQFQCLTWLGIYCKSMEVVFAPGAMQHLKNLNLEFWVQNTVQKFGDANLGLEHLSSLDHVYVTLYVAQTSPKPKEVEAVEDQIQKALDMNPSKPKLILGLTRIQDQFRIQFYVSRAAETFVDDWVTTQSGL